MIKNMLIYDNYNLNGRLLGTPRRGYKKLGDIF